MFHWEHGVLPADKDMARVARVDGKAWRAMKDKVVKRALEDATHLDVQKADTKTKSQKATHAAEARWRHEGNAGAYADA